MAVDFANILSTFVLVHVLINPISKIYIDKNQPPVLIKGK